MDVRTVLAKMKSVLEQAHMCDISYIGFDSDAWSDINEKTLIGAMALLKDVDSDEEMNLYLKGEDVI